MNSKKVYTTDEIQKISEKARPDIDSYLNCNPINPTINDKLKSQNIETELIHGSISTYRSHVGGEEHMFIHVNPSCVSDINTNKPIIVDGALNQFCISNYEQGKVFVNIGPREEIPTVAIIKPKDELYDLYYKITRY